MSQINSLSDITNNGLCIGCGICQSLVGTDKISISMSEKGRLEPEAIKPLSNLEFEKIKKKMKIDHRYLAFKKLKKAVKTL